VRGFAAIILAGGIGRRFQERDGLDVPKVLRPLLGRPMLEYVLEAVEGAGVERVVVVVGYKGEEVFERFKGRAEFAWQEQPMGTGHAVLKGLKRLGNFNGHILTLCGDVPLITGGLLRRLAEFHLESGADVTILTAELEDPSGYGRILRGPDGRVVGIVEEKDATEEQKRIREVNAGTYCFKAISLCRLLPGLTNDNKQCEFYLTDVVGEAVRGGMKVEAMVSDSPECVLGVNNPQELEVAERLLEKREGRG